MVAGLAQELSANSKLSCIIVQLITSMIIIAKIYHYMVVSEGNKLCKLVVAFILAHSSFIGKRPVVT